MHSVYEDSIIIFAHKIPDRYHRISQENDQNKKHSRKAQVENCFIKGSFSFVFYRFNSKPHKFYNIIDKGENHNAAYIIFSWHLSSEILLLKIYKQLTLL